MKLIWTEIRSTEEVLSIIEKSFSCPCLIFKHSTRCEISAMAKYRLESDWSFENSTIQPYFLDLLAHREVSRFIAEKFSVHHESPQALIIVNGECVFDASHLDISVAEIQESLSVELK
jgi:bacillithiol system protein YtxJ